ncbi:MAG: PAS domain S-box protein [Methanomicrobiaceae archaeon]|nr:PAS domain S-box protein [Methanomicrobiaceae archaeon]
MKNILVICKNNELKNIITNIRLRNKNLIYPDFCDSLNEASDMIIHGNYKAIVSEFTVPECGGISFINNIKNSGKPICFVFPAESGNTETDIDEINGNMDCIFIKEKNPSDTEEKLEQIIFRILLNEDKFQKNSLYEAKYKSVIESMDDSIYMVDRECCYLFMNNKHLERIGRSTEFINSRSYSNFHTPEESKKFSENIAHLFSSGIIIEEEYEKNGNRYLRTFAPVKDINDDQIVAANVISKKISKDTGLPEDKDSIYIVDRDCRYLSINTHHMEILGLYCEDIFIGRNYEEFHPAGKNEKFSSMIAEVFEKGDILRDEYEKGKFHFTRRFCPVVDPVTNKVAAVTIVSTNVTDQKITEKSLIEANKKLNLLNSITRHDILNQMTVLLGYFDLSRNKCQDEELKGFLEKQQKAAETIHQQISFTRDYQEIGVHKPEWQDISKMIEKPVKMLNLKDIEIENKCGNLRIFADPLLEKVFFNLIENSVRHGRKVSKISFYTGKIHHGIILVCEDNGTGIPNEEKETIFKQGYGKNTGLGLFLIREILLITGFEIHETGIFGKGAKFEITIPDMMYTQ